MAQIPTKAQVKAQNQMRIVNKKARFNYFTYDTFEAGIVLKGAEVKSIRLGKVDISESYVYITKDMEVEILNCTIQNYSHATLEAQKFDTKRPKKLLLNKSEIAKIAGKIKTGGFTAVALSLYINKRQKVKMEIALAKGKKLHDKRQTLKENDMKRQERQEVKESSRV